MSRTKRRVSTWIDWVNGGKEAQERGLMPAPKPAPLKGGRTSATSEIWDERAKRLRKRILTRYARRSGREACMEDVGDVG